MVPTDGLSSPAIILIKVDLPAPFGPSIAVTPGCRVNDTSEMATTPPKNFETPDTCTTGGDVFTG